MDGDIRSLINSLPVLRALQHAFRIVEEIQRSRCGMARQPKKDRLETIYSVVKEKPGEIPAEIAKKLNLNRSEVTRSLPAMEERGYLMSEDERGGLYPFQHFQTLNPLQNPDTYRAKIFLSKPCCGETYGKSIGKEGCAPAAN